MPLLAVSGLHAARDEAERLGADHALSILDPDGTPAPDLGLPEGRHLVLRVSDIEDAGRPGRPGPDEAFVRSVLAFARSIPADGRVLVHCHLGLSRSPAAALVMLSEWEQDPLLPGYEALPNMRILEIAEHLTGRPLVEAGEEQRRHGAAELLRRDARPLDGG